MRTSGTRLLLATILMGGCASSKRLSQPHPSEARVAAKAIPTARTSIPVAAVSFTKPAAEPNAPETGDAPSAVEDLADADEASESTQSTLPAPVEVIRPGDPSPSPDEDENASAVQPPVTLDQVIRSVHYSFPALEAVYLDAEIANGNQVAAWGAFDTKLKGSTENQPLGFYETYRHGAGGIQPLYQGGEIFGGYRLGRGVYEPWYLERETNKGGEFKTGINLPFAKDRRIDARRADLWRATYDQQRVQPEIRQQLIWFVRDASIAYWAWIAATRQVAIGEQALELAVKRNDGLERRVELQDVDPPVLQDNLRTIALREAKLIDRQRKLQQSTFKLSIFLRDETGEPLIAPTNATMRFPDPSVGSPDELAEGIRIATSQRPELAVIEAVVRRTRVDLAEAQNDALPQIDGQLIGSQDVGEPTSSTRDKSEFELEAGIFVDVPLQRRKAIGKQRASRAKLTQLDFKRRFTQDKIVAEVQVVVAALDAARQRVVRTRTAKSLAEQIADIERRKFELGESDLLAVFLREQFAIEAADDEVEALLEYYIARADHAAALAIDWPSYDSNLPQ